MSGAHIFIGTRTDKGRYGSQSKDMALTDLVTLLAPVATQYVIPDLTPLVLRFNAQIQEHLAAQANEQRDTQLMQDYDALFNAWRRAATYENSERRSRAWENVIDKAEDFLQVLKPTFPPKVYEENWKSPLISKIEHTGRVYTEALLFIITARAALEPKTLYSDATLRDYCHWLRDWVKAYLTQDDHYSLLLNAALCRQDGYPAVQVLGPAAAPQSADAFLAERIRAQKDQYVDNTPRLGSGYWRHEPKAKATNRTLVGKEFYDHHWRMVFTLRDLLYRAERIEAFLTELEQHGADVVFDHQGDITETVKALLKGDEPQLPAAPGQENP